MIDDLITYLRDKTHLTRFSRGEIREVIERMNEDGWEIVRRDDGAIAEAQPMPPEPEIDPEPEAEPDLVGKDEPLIPYQQLAERIAAQNE